MRVMIFPIERIVTVGLRNDDALATLNLILDRGGSEFESRKSPLWMTLSEYQSDLP